MLSLKMKYGFALVAVTGLAAVAIGLAHARHASHSSAAEMQIPLYDRPQKVVYHVTEGDFWFYHPHAMHVVQSALNHVNAVSKGKLDLRIVLQGDGLDLLVNATSDIRLSTAIDTLKADGVRFLVCRNSLVSRGIEPEALYGASRDDIVGAGVAEVASLEAQGFTYMKP